MLYSNRQWQWCMVEWDSERQTFNLDSRTRRRLDLLHKISVPMRIDAGWLEYQGRGKWRWNEKMQSEQRRNIYSRIPRVMNFMTDWHFTNMFCGGCRVHLKTIFWIFKNGIIRISTRNDDFRIVCPGGAAQKSPNSEDWPFAMRSKKSETPEGQELFAAVDASWIVLANGIQGLFFGGNRKHMETLQRY